MTGFSFNLLGSLLLNQFATGIKRQVRIQSLAAVESLSPLWLSCYSKNCSPPGSFVRGILQARILDGVSSISFSRVWNRVSCIAGRSLTAESEFSFHLLRSGLLNQFVTRGQPHIRAISPGKHKFPRRAFLETSPPLRGQAMEHFPRCVHASWGSSKEPQETEVLQLLSLADPEEWQLPCYPTLGERSSNKENFSRKQLSTPCGLLRPYCPKHGPGRRATAGREPGGQLWTPRPRPAGSHRRSQKGKTPRAPKASLGGFCRNGRT